MKRTGIAILGVIFGLFLTWLCLYVLSHIDWPPSNKVATGCHEIDKCPMPWWALPVIFTSVFGPAVVFGALNAVAWRRWTFSRWRWCFIASTLITIAYYAAGYIR